MGAVIYAEVIGDPIAQSKSPIIHEYWLSRVGLAGDYRATLVALGDLADFIAQRRSDPNWRGCNVTIPHKQAALSLLDEIDSGAAAIGAVNCAVPTDGGLKGYNTDVDGIAAALDDTELEGRKVAIIGAGGAARAAITYVAGEGASEIQILVRDPKKAESLRRLGPVAIAEMASPDAAFDNAAAIINASPLGMNGAAAMSPELLSAVRRHAPSATIFDMVTTPAETKFLSAGRETGAHIVDGLTMLVGQAARAFELFFGQPAPGADSVLRDLLTTDRPDSSGSRYKTAKEH
jgi:shikimate dehydrogenase